MNPTQARKLYLSYLRQSAPLVYTAAVRKAMGKPRGLGGLGDDLLTQMTRPCMGIGFLGQDDGSTDYSNLPTVTVTATDTSGYDQNLQDLINANSLPDQSLALAVTPEALAPVNLTDVTGTSLTALPPSTTDTTSTSTAPGIFASIASAVGGIVAAGMTASSQSSLLKLNTQRAAAGLPPVNANGVPISTSLLTPSSNPTIAALENSVAGAASSPLVWMAGIGLLAFLLLRKKGSST